MSKGLVIVRLGGSAAGAAVLATGGAGLLVLQPGRPGILSSGALVCTVTFVLWPWAVLPAGIIGGVAATKMLGASDVTFVIIVHSGILAAGCLSLLVRRIVFAGCDRPVKTPADSSMLSFAAFIVLAGGYGLAGGNAPYDVLIAGYEFAVIPLYFFLATHTLTGSREFAAAGVLYIGGATALAAAELTMPGRHGGLLSVLAIPPLLVVISRVTGWRQAGLLLLVAGLSVDAVLASYRAMWLAAGVALLVLVVRGTATLRRSVAGAVLTGALLTVSAAAFSAGARDRSGLLKAALEESAGYRAQESAIGLAAFAERPLFGHGLGQSVPHTYLDGFAVTDVGPTYHVFYVMVLANLGLVGLALLVLPLMQAVRYGIAARGGQPLALAALTCGFTAAAAFAGPTDGHWELGLLTALTLMVVPLPPAVKGSM
ncbi:O-antigen ligase family protein [Streptomyces wuyuanensis]|uniref:O-antigen ligase family protein n=1 Tax=Streptomyces wuyuanensis TaxID=1196353 RepID=UPI0034497843